MLKTKLTAQNWPNLKLGNTIVDKVGGEWIIVHKSSGDFIDVTPSNRLRGRDVRLVMGPNDTIVVTSDQPTAQVLGGTETKLLVAAAPALTRPTPTA